MIGELWGSGERERAKEGQWLSLSADPGSSSVRHAQMLARGESASTPLTDEGVKVQRG